MKKYILLFLAVVLVLQLSTCSMNRELKLPKVLQPKVLIIIYNPIILSKISGNFVEICRSSLEECVYWNMERKGYKVIAKLQKNN